MLAGIATLEPPNYLARPLFFLALYFAIVHMLTETIYSESVLCKSSFRNKFASV